MKDFPLLDKFEYKHPSLELKDRNVENRPQPLKDLFETRYSFDKNQHLYKLSAKKKKEATLMFVGDLLCQELMIENCKTDGNFDFSSCFDYVRPIFKSADFVAGNLETPIFSDAPFRGEILTHEGPFYCNAPIEYLDALKYAGFDMLTTANNHMLDAGAQGLYETIFNCRELGFIQTGTFPNRNDRYVIVDIGGIKVGFTAFAIAYNSMNKNLTRRGKTTLLNTYTYVRAQKIYDAMKKAGADYTICFPHWGVEHQQQISSIQSNMARELSEIGYDLTVGSHSHLIQEFSKFNNGKKIMPVLYSLGNLISHLNFGASRENSKYTVIMKVVLKRKHRKVIPEISFIPCCITKKTDNTPFSVIPIAKDIPLSNEAEEALKDTESMVKELLKSEDAIIETDFKSKSEDIDILKERIKNRQPLSEDFLNQKRGEDPEGEILIEKLTKEGTTDDCEVFVTGLRNAIYYVYKDHAELVAYPGNYNTTASFFRVYGKPVTVIKNITGETTSRRVIYTTRNTKQIEPYTFKNWKKLESIRIYKNLEEIGEGAFEGCSNMTGIRIPESIVEIKSRTFADCVKLQSIKIPISVRKIADDAFVNCDKLTIYGEASSYAEEYAKSHNIPFKEIPTNRMKKVNYSDLSHMKDYEFEPLPIPTKNYITEGKVVYGPSNGPKDKHPVTIRAVCDLVGYPLPKKAVCKKSPSHYIPRGVLPVSTRGMYKILSHYIEIDEDELRSDISKFKRTYNRLEYLSPNSTDFSVYFIDWQLTAKPRGYSYNDYFDYEFFRKEPAVRETFLSEGFRERVFRMGANPKYIHIFKNKAHFNAHFPEFIKRDWIDTTVCTYDEFCKFIKKHKKFFAKPIEGFSGSGARVIESDSDTPDNLYRLCKSNTFIAEEIATQHKELSEFNDSTLNTVRVNTLLCADGVPRIVLAMARFGRSGNVVDNFHGGGVGAVVDPETGIMISEAIDRRHNLTPIHPDSKKSILGFQYPMWDKVKEAVCTAALKIPQMRNVGWDVSLTQDGEVEFIEGNSKPSYDVLQSPDQIGRRYRYGNRIEELEEMFGIEKEKVMPYRIPVPYKKFKKKPNKFTGFLKRCKRKLKKIFVNPKAEKSKIKK
jgi:poly-gamma-glutamate capsule biosynthesis protein CapA/YwtB (metallophosphatase superfamily)